MTVSPQVEPYNLTPEQIQSYNDNGFLLIEDYLSAEEHQTLESFCNELQNWGKEKGKWMQYYEVSTVTSKKILCQTENFIPYHEGMRSYASNPRLLEVLKMLCGEEFILFKEKINYKLPGGGGFLPHQDAPDLIQFGQYSHTAVMFAIDAATQENGCLEVVPGSHKNDYENRILPREPDGTLSREWCNKNEWAPVCCKPGAVLIFGAYLAHRSGGNVTEKSRKAVYLTYNSAAEGDFRERYFENKRRLFPPSYEREEGKDYSEGATMYNFPNPIVP